MVHGLVLVTTASARIGEGGLVVHPRNTNVKWEKTYFEKLKANYGVGVGFAFFSRSFVDTLVLLFNTPAIESERDLAEHCRLPV